MNSTGELRRLSVSDLADLVGGQVRRPSERVVSGVGELCAELPIDLVTFYDGSRSRLVSFLACTGVVFVKASAPVVPHAVHIVCEDPWIAFALAGEHFTAQTRKAGVHPTAVIGEGCSLHSSVHLAAHVVVGDGATIGANTVVWPGVYIGENTTIGEACTLHPNVVVYCNTLIHNEVVIGAGSVVGGDGFGHRRWKGRVVAMPHHGRVVIDSGVHIGANCTIDRSVTGETRVGAFSRLDNLVHLGHGVQLGARSLLAAFVGLSGRAEIGEEVTFAGRSSVVPGVKIGRGSILFGVAAATKSWPANSRIGGVPGRSHRQWLRQISALRLLIREVDGRSVASSNGEPDES